MVINRLRVEFLCTTSWTAIIDTDVYIRCTDTDIYTLRSLDQIVKIIGNVSMLEFPMYMVVLTIHMVS